MDENCSCVQRETARKEEKKGGGEERGRRSVVSVATNRFKEDLANIVRRGRQINEANDVV